MLNHLSILLTGFSIFSIVILLIAYVFFLPDMRKSFTGKLAAIALLLSLCFLQVGHYAYFLNDIPLLNYRAYGSLLLFLPPTFYFYSRVILFPEIDYKLLDALHFIPSIISIALPVSTLAPLGFLFGTAYTFWFALLIFKLRNQSKRFKFEIFFFGLFAIIASVALALCLSLPYIDTKIFYFTYSNSISCSVMLIVCALLFFPKLLSDILLITELTYAKSKLSGINTEQKIKQLEQLMLADHLFENEDLSLKLLADQLDLTSHQLSELLNTKFQCSFPRYIREHRVRQAKTLLIDEPNSSILAISMSTGFKSQSNFYTAFKEITGLSPGQYRKNGSV